MSIFNGQYYLNEHKEVCDLENYSQTLTCNLYEIDLNNLNNRKVALDNINPQPSKLGEKIVNMLQLRVIYSQNKCENLAKFGIFASFLAVWFRVRI